MAGAAGLPVTPRSANLSMVTLFTMHLLKSLKDAGKYLELSIEGADCYPWRQDLFTCSPFSVENGCVRVPDRPGWGVDINPDWLARSEYSVSGIEQP